MSGVEIRHSFGGGAPVAVFEFDAEDCRNIARCLPPGDAGAAELLAAADELDRYFGEVQPNG